mgnify:CR=1 FL=1
MITKICMNINMKSNTIKNRDLQIAIAVFLAGLSCFGLLYYYQALLPDLVEYFTTVFRNKSGSSGGDISFVGSQELGIQEGLSMYHMLKEEKYFGLTGSAVRHTCALYPECTLMRTTVRDLIEGEERDPKLYRAIEITWQLWFIQTFWSNIPANFRITPEELYNAVKEQGVDWNDILDNTVYFWHDNPEHIKKHTLTVYELLEIAVNKKKPY